MEMHKIKRLQYRDCYGNFRDELDLEDYTKPLYQYQLSLPRLPVPRLEDTIILYLQTIYPLVSRESFRQTCALANSFLHPKYGIGRKVQERLIQYAKEKKDTSFLIEWWTTQGYLFVRDPIVINVSYYFQFADSLHTTQMKSQAHRAASLIYGTISFYQQIKDQTLPPEVLGKSPHGKPLCASAYKYMFHSCRIPGDPQDFCRLYNPIESSHVVVLYYGCFYLLEMKDQVNQWRSIHTLVQQLEWILTQSPNANTSSSLPIGILTSLPRDEWAVAYKTLISEDERNEVTIRAIESSILVLCLEDDSMKEDTLTDMSRMLLHGNGMNRYFDKTVQLVVTRRAKAGLVGEHSMIDGMPMVRYASTLLSQLEKNDPFTVEGPKPTTSILPPMHLPIYSNTSNAHGKRSLAEWVAYATSKFNWLIAQQDYHVEKFDGYGSNIIKKHFGCSPDAIAQLAMQLAYKKLTGTNGGTYEATQTRYFLHGRTETTRSCSIASDAFVNAMIAQPTTTKTREIKRKLLQAAAKSHSQYLKRASLGLGVDRHFFALRNLLTEDEKKHASAAFLLTDESMKVSSRWKMSTSHLTFRLFTSWGYGQVVPEGYGIAYSVHDNYIQYNIACMNDPYTQRARDMGKLLAESLDDIRNLFIAPQANL